MKTVTAPQNGETFPKVCIIGTGFSGLCAAIQLQRKLKTTNFTVYEMNEDVGGAWFANTYPGCACDIQSHLYSFSFAPKPGIGDWTKEFASQPEILEYIRSVARKFHVYKFTKFRHQVNELKWDEKLSQWKVTVTDLVSKEKVEVLYDIVVNGSGELRKPKIPEEFQQFKGPLIHSAEWDPTIPLEGKVVAVVGSGATAIQLIPSIVNKVGKLLCYQRAPAWIIPSFQTTFTNFTKWTFTTFPGLQSTYRKSLFLSNELAFPVFEHGTVLSKIGNAIAVGVGKHHLNNMIKEHPEMREQLVPNYRFGCKRVGISNKYYRALDNPHVKMITSKVDQVGDSWITTMDGKREEIDVLILATGFRVHDYFAPMEIFGRNGENILQKWKDDGPTGYLGITSNCMPNLFTLLGPGSDVNHNSGIFQIECQVNWMIKIIREMQTRRANYFAVKHATESVYMARMQKAMMKTVYGNFKCGSWFANDDKGIVTALYPKSSISYWRQARKIDYNGFDFISINQ